MAIEVGSFVTFLHKQWKAVGVVYEIPIATAASVLAVMNDPRSVHPPRADRWLVPMIDLTELAPVRSESRDTDDLEKDGA
jgi:hypothetical protein